MKDFVGWILFIALMCLLFDSIATTEKSLGERHCKLQARYFGAISQYVCENDVIEYHIQ